MSKLSHRLEDRELVIALDGRVDTNNASETEAALDEIVSSTSFDTVVLDCENLDYLSSAGLRVVLRLAKKVPEVRIVNVSSAIYEVLEMTGFTELFTVTKAYRRVSVDGCPVIGQGANGVVYRIDPETICKVYRNPDALPEIHRERELARAAFVAGIPTAISYDVVRVGDGYGSVFELLNAESMADLLASGAYSVERVAQECAELLLQMAETEVDPDIMPPVLDEAVRWVDDIASELEPSQYGRLKELVAGIPDINRMVHGDFHIKNVLVQDGEPLLIDMDTLSHGDPVFDLAATYSAYVGYGVVDPSKIDNFLGVSHEVSAHLWDLILQTYLHGASDEQVAAAEDKIRLMSALRLMGQPIRHHKEGTEEGRRTIAAYRAIVDELLPRVESLAL